MYITCNALMRLHQTLSKHKQKSQYEVQGCPSFENNYCIPTTSYLTIYFVDNKTKHMELESPKLPSFPSSSVIPSTGRMSGHSMKRSDPDLIRSPTPDRERSKRRESVSEGSLSPKFSNPSPPKIEAQESKSSYINHKNGKQKVLFGVSLLLLVLLYIDLKSSLPYSLFWVWACTSCPTSTKVPESPY